MKQLSPEVRQKVVKMSDGRLKQKLVQAGYREVDVATLDRGSLLEYYAKVVLTETAYVPARRNKMRMMKMVVIVKRRWSLLRVMQMCTILRVEINRCRRGVLQWRKERFGSRRGDWRNSDCNGKNIMQRGSWRKRDLNNNWKYNVDRV